MKKAILTLFLLSCFTNFAQDSELGNWIMYFGNKQLNKNWNWHHEVQYRNYNAVGDLEQLLLRTGIGYNLTEKNNNLLLGYGYIRSENYLGDTDDKLGVNEHRIYQQFITKQKAGIVGVQNRFRFEQRFIEDGDFKLRVRYFLGLNIPLTNLNLDDKTLYLSIYNEIFLNTENDIFGRDRLYGGVGYKLNHSLRFELGYMNQFFKNGERDQVNIMAFVSF